MYKPNFCAECGEKVVRARWYPWTSRRFCKYCSPRSLKARFATPLFVCALLVGAGLMAGRAMRQPAPPLIIQNSQGLTISPQWTPKHIAATRPVGDAPPEKAQPNGTSELIKEKPATTSQIITLCGARTKKGTMCTRRVRGGGRCWQHKGLPAMLPPEKLVVQG